MSYLKRTGRSTQCPKGYMHEYPGWMPWFIIDILVDRCRKDHAHG